LVIRSNDQEKRVRSNGREEKNGIHNNQSRIKKMEKKRKERKKERKGH
jgi:hypothetical protein